MHGHTPAQAAALLVPVPLTPDAAHATMPAAAFRLGSAATAQSADPGVEAALQQLIAAGVMAS
eukprot:671244-Alexandrium_andersonii.AAC.1